MEEILDKNSVSLEGLTYEEAEVICKALDDYRYNYKRSSKSSDRMESECADYLYIELDEALRTVDEDNW